MSPDTFRAAGVTGHLRRLRRRAVLVRLRESLLFLPALMLLASAAAAVILGQLDSAHQSRPWPFTFSFAPGTASTLLGIIAGATITTAGVVFSLLVVSLQLASGQFSPRVLRGFWRDQFGQVMIGLLLSTFAFCGLSDGSAIYVSAKRAVPGAAELIRAAVILGPARTMQQDIDFGLRQLNDVALRALSPAVNDPATAIEVVLRVGSVMRPLVLAAIARTQRMLRGACLIAGAREDIVRTLDKHLALTVACCSPGMLPEDRARVEDAAAT